MTSFEKEISCLGWKLEARKGHGIRGKRFHLLALKRKLEYSVNYRTSLSIKGRGRCDGILSLSL